MLVIELTYLKPLSEVNLFVDEHRAFINKYTQQGIFITSGPKVPRDGGVILSHADCDVIDEIIKEDPFCREQIAEFRFIQFESPLGKKLCQ
jgi:uncharacterized protein YciI